MSLFGEHPDHNTWSEREIGDRERRIQEYLLERARDGPLYIKSKEIAADLGLSTKQVGPSIAILKRDGEVLDIGRWTDSGTGVTWHVEPVAKDGGLP